VADNKRVIVVLGMDRSGTSLCTNVLSALGVWLGPDLLPGDRFNEPGYFEDREIWRLHERMLAVLGRSWDSLATIRPLPPLWWESQTMQRFRNQLTQIARARIAGAGERTWGFKDPRLIQLLPLWNRVLEDLGLRPIFVLCVRHPGAVAQSLAARDGFPALISELLWLERTLTACSAIRQAVHCIVHYEEWFVNPWRAVERLAQTTGLKPATGREELHARVAALIKRELRHDGEESNPIHSRAAADFYGYLAQSTRVPEPEIVRKFEAALAVSREFIEGAEAIAGRTLPGAIGSPSYMHCTREDLETIEEGSAARTEVEHDPKLIRTQRLLAEREAQLRVHGAALAHAEGLVQKLEGQVREYVGALADAQQLVSERDAQLRAHTEGLTHAEGLVEERDVQLRGHAEGLAHAEGLVQKLEGQVREYVGALDEAQQLVSERDMQLRAHTEGLAHAEGQVQKLEDQVREYVGALDEAQRLVAERDAQLRAHAKGLAHAEGLLQKLEGQVREYVGALDEAQRLVAERDAQLRAHAKGLAHAEGLVQKLEGQVRKYDQGLADAQRLVDERDVQLRDHVKALGDAEGLVQQLERQVRQTAEGLSEAQGLVAARDALLQEYSKGLAHAEDLVSRRDAELKRYAEALEEAQRFVAKQNLN